MSETRWVTAGPGKKKWMVKRESNYFWVGEGGPGPDSDLREAFLLKEDYDLCSAPERWERIELAVRDEGTRLCDGRNFFLYSCGPLFRFVPNPNGDGSIFIERKVGE